MTLPDFMIIGAMKCATSSLYERLALQPGIMLLSSKEPNFFSNDEIFEHGIDWYKSLFGVPERMHLAGEASTHYTKLPTYRNTVERIHEHVLKLNLTGRNKLKCGNQLKTVIYYVT